MESYKVSMEYRREGRGAKKDAAYRTACIQIALGTAEKGRECI